MDQGTLWKQYLQVLNETIQPGKGQVIHIAYPYGQWNWGGREPVEGSYAYAQWVALNVVPANASVNLNAQSATSGFDVAYRDWFEALTVGDLGKDAHYASLQDEVSRASNRLGEVIDEAQAKWERDSKGTNRSFREWLESLENTRFADAVQQAQEDYKAKQDELQQYRNRIESPVSNIAKAFQNPDQTASVTDPQTGKSLEVRTWSTDPATPWDYVSEITGGNFGADATAGTASTITFSNQSKEYTYDKTEVGTEVGAGLVVDDVFIGVEGEGGYVGVDTTKAESRYDFTISWQDMKRVPISPAAWYAGANLETFGRGENYASGFSAFRNGDLDYFFGAGGSLSRIYDSMIVAYRPKVAIDAGASFADELVRVWNASLGVEGGMAGVGGLEFGGEAGGERKKSVVKRSGSKVSIESRDDWPLILGYVSSWTLAPA